jgi:hypothetical protein
MHGAKLIEATPDVHPAETIITNDSPLPAALVRRGIDACYVVKDREDSAMNGPISAGAAQLVKFNRRLWVAVHKPGPRA